MLRVGALVFLAALSVAPSASAQHENVPIDRSWSVEALRGQSAEWLRAIYVQSRRQLERDELTTEPWGRKADAWLMEEWRQWLDHQRQILENLRQALAEKGERPPGMVIRPRGGTPATTARPPSPSGGTPTRTIPPSTQPGGTATVDVPPPRTGGATRPGTSAASRTVLPLMVVLTAAEIAKCANNGIGIAACAYALAENAALGAAVGTLVTVIIPSGAAIMTAVAVGGSALTLVVTSVEVGSEVIADAHAVDELVEASRNQREQQQANAGRVTSRQIDQMVEALKTRLGRARASTDDDPTLVRARQALTRVVEAARTEFDAFRPLNQTTRAALASCQAAQTNPVALVAAAERKQATLEQMAAAMDRIVYTALSNVNSCVGVEEIRAAREAIPAAQRQLAQMDPLVQDIANDLRSALAFFAKVKAARISVVEAGKKTGRLGQLAEAARAARPDVRAALAEYSLAMSRARQEHVAIFATIQNLRGAFPQTLSPQLAAGFNRIDEAYVGSIATIKSNDAIDEIARRVDDEVSRVEGMYRLAIEEYADNLEACRGVSDDMPAPLRAALGRVATDASNAYRRAQASVESAKVIPARADACASKAAAAPTTPPPARTAKPVVPPPPAPSASGGSEWLIGFRAGDPNAALLRIAIRDAQLEWTDRAERDARVQGTSDWRPADFSGAVEGARVRFELSYPAVRGASGRYWRGALKYSCALTLTGSGAAATMAGTCTTSGTTFAQDARGMTDTANLVAIPASTSNVFGVRSVR